MKVELRDYQAEAFEKAREAIRQGHRRILINAPTGSGKTILAAALMEMTNAKGNRATFVVDRLSLIDQTSAVFDRYGLDHGVIQGGHLRWRPQERIQLCSIQTVARRRWPEAKVDVFDEAHVLYKTHIERMKTGGTVVIGLTATPFTRGLGKHFDCVINVTTTRKLINDGWLSPYRMFSCVEPDMEGVKVSSNGEWEEREASDRALKVVGDVVEEYLKHGEGRKFICSGVDTAHVQELQRQFLARGINAATYTYKDKEEDRSETTTEFRKPDSAIRGLITVTAASRGFDVPDVSCIIMARPLRKSLSEHIQLFGRGLRICEGKTDCVVLDHSGNCARFFDDTETFFDNGLDQLDMGEKLDKNFKKDKPEPCKCPQCHAIHKPSPVCPVCGHEYPRRRAVEHVAGTLKELITKSKEGGLAKDQRKVLSSEVWPQVCGWVLSKREKDDKARKQALAIYHSITGGWPDGDFSSTIPIPCGQEVRNRIIQQQILFNKGYGRSRSPA